MTESEAKLIESMADDYSNVLKEAKSMGCKEIRALYNIPLKNMELIINALEKQIAKKPRSVTSVEDGMYVKCPTCKLTTVLYYGCIMDYCKNCGQKLDWSDEE